MSAIIVWRAMAPLSTQQRMDAIYAKANSCADNAKVVSMVFEMLGLLENSNQVYHTDVHPKRMGIHPKKGAKIHKAGFSLKLCGPDRAVAFEERRTR